MPIDFPTPPAIIFNAKKNKQYHRLSSLGQGGFAKCYKVLSDNHEFAIKCIHKKSLKNPKHVSKLKSEIKIHSQLNHTNIVKCYSYFEDREFVYLVLELCHLKTLGSMLRTRHTLSEPECRYFMLQILHAIQYLHKNQIIHRDLKLGNILLTSQMTVKLADFGLAALVTNEQRKKTLCGTPNYLAPEILLGTANGHSYEVDIWSYGCVLYTLLFSKPPFQSKDVNDIYHKIKNTLFEIPPNSIHHSTDYLIHQCLQNHPEKRPSASQLLLFDYFKCFTPKSLPVSSLASIPQFDNEPQSVLQSNPQSNLQSDPHSLTKKQSTQSIKRVDSHLTPIKSKSIRHSSPMSIPSTPSKIPTPIKRKNTIQLYLSNLRHCFKCAEYHYIAHHAPIPWPQQSPQSTFNTLHPPKWPPHPPHLPSIFIIKWIDYSNKIGLSYELTNGIVGILFNDLNSILINSNNTQLCQLELTSHQGQSQMHIMEHSVNELDGYLLKRYKMVMEFKKYMATHLSGQLKWTGSQQNGFNEQSGESNELTPTVYLQKWLKFKHAVVFRFNNNQIQMNFQDHTKMILNEYGSGILYIKEKQVYSGHVEEILMQQGGLNGVICEEMVDRLLKMIEFLQVLDK
eukprot:NODE_243_length_11887_cov_0.520699.p1 type:complete len:622 gc:universal NODE_243_length_11887_cov_0.520699:5572-7437(+)